VRLAFERQMGHSSSNRGTPSAGRLTRLGALCAGLGGAIVLLGPAPAGASHGSVLPAGTPYAAEVEATLTGSTEIHYTDDATTYEGLAKRLAKRAKTVDWRRTRRWAALAVAGHSKRGLTCIRP